MGALDRRRREVVGSSEAADLLGLRGSRLGLWMRKAGMLPDEGAPDDDRMEWGRRLEPVIGEATAERMGWRLEKGIWVRHPELAGMGATPDFLAAPSGTTPAAVLEVKTVDRFIFKREWIERTVPGVDWWGGAEWYPADRQPPIEYQLQVQHQLAVTGFAWGYLAVLVGGNDLILYRLARHHRIVALLEREVAAFWDSVAKGALPAIDWRLDARSVIALYQESSEEVADLRGQKNVAAMTKEYAALGREIREREQRREELKARLLPLVGKASRALVDGGTISAKAVGPKVVPQYTRSAYRSFRVNVQEEEEEA